MPLFRCPKCDREFARKAGLVLHGIQRHGLVRAQARALAEESAPRSQGQGEAPPQDLPQADAQEMTLAALRLAALRLMEEKLEVELRLVRELIAREKAGLQS